ncbi:hypothetical protein ACQ4PT_032208 [Festuca glaucescens]
MEGLIISGLAGIDIFPGEGEAKPAKKRGGAEQNHPRGNAEQSRGRLPATEEDLISSGLAGIDLFFPTGEKSDPGKAAKKRGVKAKFARRVKPPPPPLTPPPPYKAELPRVFREEVHAISDYRGRWDALFAGEYGSFEDQTNLGPMRHTFGPIPRYAVPECTFQVFHIRVDNLRDGLQWPLHVHGMVAARDHADHNRNFLFSRTRDNCQILTQEDPYLLLTGPSRAIVIVNPITLEVQLKVKSKTEPGKDEPLAFDIFNYHKTYLMENVICASSFCRRCDIEFAYASLVPSVEATVAAIQVVDGTWPDCFCGCVAARITSIKEGTVLLLDSRDGAMPISSSTGAIELSRRVVSVDLKGGELVISVVASQISGEDGGDIVARGEVVFRPKKAGTSHGMCELGFCKIKVTVAWSLLSTLSDVRLAAAKRMMKTK